MKERWLGIIYIVAPTQISRAKKILVALEKRQSFIRSPIDPEFLLRLFQHCPTLEVLVVRMLVNRGE